MRILHTSDWHLGKKFHGASLDDEQTRVGTRIAEISAELAVDAVLIAGDLYDRSQPPADAVSQLDEALEAIRASGAVVVGIAGNHDSGPRIGMGERAMTRGGITLRGDVGRSGEPVIVADRDGNPGLAVLPIPYLDPPVAAGPLELPTARTHAEVMRAAVGRAAARRPAGLPSVVVAHGFVAGGNVSDSERTLAVGGAELIAVEVFAGFDYVALGHLHRPQAITETVHYSGSPLPYSFSEGDDTKGVRIIDLDQRGITSQAFVPLGVGRPAITIRGELNELLHSAAHNSAEEAWLRAELTDQQLPRDAMRQLQRRFPHAVALAHHPAAIASLTDQRLRHRLDGPNDLERAVLFYSEVIGEAPGDTEVSTLAGAIDLVASKAAA